VDDVVASGDAAVLYVPRSAATDECTLCETVTGFVQGYLYANHTEQEIQEGLDVLCSLLPDSQQCTTMVDQYLAAIYMFLRFVTKRHPQLLPSSLTCCGVLWCPGRTPTRTSCAQRSSSAVRSELPWLRLPSWKGLLPHRTLHGRFVHIFQKFQIRTNVLRQHF
jgi:hypothetical protein